MLLAVNLINPKPLIGVEVFSHEKSMWLRPGGGRAKVRHRGGWREQNKRKHKEERQLLTTCVNALSSTATSMAGVLERLVPK